MSKKKKKTPKIQEKMHQLFRNLVVKINIVIFLPYFVEEVFLNFMLERI